MLTNAPLLYLSKRLGIIGGGACTLAFMLVSDAISDFDHISNNLDAEHDLFHQLWELVSRALDHDDFHGEHRDMLEAMEAEMAGRVLNIRLQKGELLPRPVAEVAKPRQNAFSNILGNVWRSCT